MNKRQKKKFKKKLYHRKWTKYKEWKGVVTIIRRQIRKYPAKFKYFCEVTLPFNLNQSFESNNDGDDTNEQETEKEVWEKAKT